MSAIFWGPADEHMFKKTSKILIKEEVKVFNLQDIFVHTQRTPLSRNYISATK